MLRVFIRNNNGAEKICVNIIKKSIANSQLSMLLIKYKVYLIIWILIFIIFFDEKFE